MDAAKLQAKLYAGYAKAAQRIGYMTDVFRATSASNPTATGNKVVSIHASFNAEDMKYGRPNKYGHPTWFALLDGSQTQVGDYLINAQDGAYFVAAQQTNLPILAVQCNRVVSVLRPQLQTAVGASNAYGGNTSGTETVLMADWPASVLQGTKGERSEAELPGDVRNPWWSILMPLCSGVVIRSGDIAADELGRRYVVSSAELTDLGWRLTAAQAQT